MSQTHEQRNMWLPQYWPAWLGIAIFWLVDKLTWPEKRRIARGLGWFTFNIVRIRRAVVITNLELCFPEKSAGEINTLARANFDALALAIFELCAGCWAKPEDLPSYRIIGLFHLQQALERSQGVILLSAHYTTIGMSTRILVENHPTGMLYRDPNHPVFAHMFHTKRAEFMSPTVHFEDLRGLIRALRKGSTIWYAPDQSKLTKFSEIIPFFGEPAITNTATSKIASMTGAAVVPYFANREADHSYTLTILPALENFPTANAAEDALRINRLIEEYVRLAPEQYFWIHKRFKRRGPGYPEVY